MATAYEFTFDKIRLRVIDTAGFADTRHCRPSTKMMLMCCSLTPSLCYRGPLEDKKNIERTVEHLRNYKHINGICVLLKPNQSRLTLSFKYVLQELLKQLHKSAAQNLLFCFTNSRSSFYRPGDTMVPLRSFLQDLQSQSGVEIPLSKATIFCFDSEPFRCSSPAIGGGENYFLS